LCAKKYFRLYFFHEQLTKPLSSCRLKCLYEGCLLIHKIMNPGFRKATPKPETIEQKIPEVIFRDCK
ncbi:hypothetical protein, partial [Chryseobacterium arthrosphaerae]|uniref:hypothetical protein n=1 Tax=Chryseobacterium arthrosphaerae TaxID=651561 RepID=UPI00241F2563